MIAAILLKWRSTSDGRNTVEVDTVEVIGGVLLKWRSIAEVVDYQ